jgi:hypothetical protein
MMMRCIELMVTVCLFAVCLFVGYSLKDASAEQRSADLDLQGWQNTRWGMTADQVREAVPGVVTIPDAFYVNEPYMKLRLPSYQIGECHFDVVFLFNSDEKLDAVYVRLDGEKSTVLALSIKEVAYTCKRRISQLFFEKYGKSARESSVENGFDSPEKEEWIFPSTTIRLLHLRWPTTGSFGINYMGKIGPEFGKI